MQENLSAKCSECKHSDHAAGRCGSCNCGESERIESVTRHDMRDVHYTSTRRMDEYVRQEGYRASVPTYDW